MAHLPVACWALAILAAACELLAAFGIEEAGSVRLLPLGLVFVALTLLAHHPHPAA